MAASAIRSDPGRAAVGGETRAEIGGVVVPPGDGLDDLRRDGDPVAPVREHHDVADPPGPAQLNHENSPRSLSQTGDGTYHRRRPCIPLDKIQILFRGNHHAVERRSRWPNRRPGLSNEPLPCSRASAIAAGESRRHREGLRPRPEHGASAPAHAGDHRLRQQGRVRHVPARESHHPARGTGPERPVVDRARRARHGGAGHRHRRVGLPQHQGARRDGAVHQHRRGHAFGPARQLGRPDRPAGHLGGRPRAPRQGSRGRVRRRRAWRRGGRHRDRLPGVFPNPSRRRAEPGRAELPAHHIAGQAVRPDVDLRNGGRLRPSEQYPETEALAEGPS